MTTMTQEQPSGPVLGAEDDFVHLYCCNPDRSECGLDLSDAEDNGDADASDDDCPLCVFIGRLDLPCGEPGCPAEGVL